MDSTSHRSNPTHKYIGYTIGILGILVSAGVIYGVMDPKDTRSWHEKIFPPRKLSPEERAKGLYENMVPFIPRFHFVVFAGWLLAVYMDKLLVFLLIFGLWLIGLISAAVCACFYFFEDKERTFKDREVFLIAGTIYWTCSLIISGIWFLTRKVDEPLTVNESELTPIK